MLQTMRYTHTHAHIWTQATKLPKTEISLGNDATANANVVHLSALALRFTKAKKINCY